MGIPVAYSEVLLPKLFLQIGLSLGFLRQIIAWTFDAVGLGDLLDSDDHWPDPSPQRQPPSADCELSQGLHPISAIIQEVLPVVRFEDLLSKLGENDDRRLVADGCAICLYEFEPYEEVRCLKTVDISSTTAAWTDGWRTTSELVLYAARR
ncbi:hypothetical protein HPP92_007102 [Vanilla planifolia]|uniref:Uncharacterized protein n=1 Tax=Vanilla planifolia TaxID=51239 RepID=A0A835V7E2_VANPL|nr:hypothetical protein HPP92_007102 [Vanilla planifolia]